MRQEPPSHQRKLVILMLRLRAAVVRPMMRLPGDAGGVHRPVDPCAHVVGADDVMIDPVHGAFGFDVCHD